MLVTLMLTLTAQTAQAEDIVTKDNFFSYFDESGFLKDEVTSSVLTFQGEFSSSDLPNYITLDRSITITGDNAVLNNMGFVIVFDDVSLNNMTLVSNTDLRYLIYVEASNVTLDNVSVTYNAPNEVDAKAIFANDADNFKLTNSEITFTGANPGEDHYRGLEVRNCDGAVIDKNTITATFPAVAVDYSGWGSIAQDLVLAVGIQGGDDVAFTNNTVKVNTNGDIGSYPTIDAIMVYSANNILIKGNNITHLDTTTEDSPRYYYTLDIYSTTGTIEANDITINTTTTPVVDRAGTAYPIQLTGPFTFTVKDNNITVISKGPVAGIYATNWGGAGTLTVENNIINVTGYATTSNYALVAGIEAEIGIASELDRVMVYNNTITVDNAADYDDANQVIGVGIGTSGFSGDASADIKYNDITVDGKYAVYYAKAKDTNVTENVLIAHELTGDAAVYFKSGDNNTVENNLDAFVNMPKTGESTYNIPANVSSFKVHDDGGISGRYSSGCTGTLTLTAPEGYLLQLSGNITTEKDNDYLTVYDGSDNLANVLIDQVSSSDNDTETAIPTVISTGNVMTLNFCSNNSGSDKTEFDGLNLTVRLIYNLNETDGITDAIATEIAGKPAQFQRTGITANAYSTVCLPFDFTAPTGCTIYGFQGIHYDENALGVGQGAWVADIAAASTMTAHTPYIFTCTGTEATFSGTASDADNYSSALTSNAVSATVGDDQAWTFKGTYSAIDWSSADPTEPTYGFSTYVPDATIAAGTFVRFVKGASLAPFRARLIYSGSDTHLAAPKRSAATELPQYIIVRIVESDGSTTAIGTLDTRTGEISTGDWFDLNGRRLSGKPAKKGLYINNGNKVVIK